MKLRTTPLPKARRKQSPRALWGLALLLSGLWPATAAEGPVAPRLEDFKLISDRNIFNPNRSQRQARSERPPPPTERPPRRESLALLGTLSYRKGEFAVFGGSESSFRQVLTVSDQVAGCKITKVATDQVTLEQNGRPIELRVGMQMERQEQGEWNVTGAAQPLPEERGASLASLTNKNDSGSPAQEDDVLKRLLEKRAKELNQ